MVGRSGRAAPPPRGRRSPGLGTSPNEKGRPEGRRVRDTLLQKRKKGKGLSFYYGTIGVGGQRLPAPERAFTLGWESLTTEKAGPKAGE